MPADVCPGCDKPYTAFTIVFWKGKPKRGTQVNLPRSLLPTNFPSLKFLNKKFNFQVGIWVGHQRLLPNFMSATNIASSFQPYQSLYSRRTTRTLTFRKQVTPLHGSELICVKGIIVHSRLRPYRPKKS